MYLPALSTGTATESLEQRNEREQLNLQYYKNTTANSIPIDVYYRPFDRTETGFSYRPNEKGERNVQPVLIPFTAAPINLNQDAHFNYFDVLRSFTEEFRKKGICPKLNEQRMIEKLASEFCQFPIKSSAVDYSFHSQAINLYFLFGDDVEFSMRKEVEDADDDRVSFSISYKGKPVYVDTERLEDLKVHLTVFLNKLCIHV